MFPVVLWWKSGGADFGVGTGFGTVCWKIQTYFKVRYLLAKFDTMIDKKQYTFELEASPYSWMLYAQDLHEAANIIIKHSGYETNRFPQLDTGASLENAFFLNFGFSVENLLKATLIALEKNEVDNFRISNGIKSHNLKNLADKVIKLSDLDLKDNEMKHLETLSSAIPSWGRYPVPLSYNQVSGKTDYTFELHEELESIWNKLIMNLYNLIKDGEWVSPSGIRTGWFRDSTLEKDFDKNLSQKDNELMKLNASNVDISKTIYVD